MASSDKSKLDEFRNNNVTLLKERDELKRFEGIDPDDVRKLADEKQRAGGGSNNSRPAKFDKVHGGAAESRPARNGTRQHGVVTRRT